MEKTNPRSGIAQDEYMLGRIIEVLHCENRREPGGLEALR
jgi:hypothetical protein